VADRGDGLAGADEVAHEVDRPWLQPELVRVDDAARHDEPVIGRGSAEPRSASTGISSALSWWFQPRIEPGFGATTWTSAPAARSAFAGSVSSTCSTPSVASTAIFLPSSLSAMVASLGLEDPTNRPGGARSPPRADPVGGTRQRTGFRSGSTPAIEGTSGS
jgi:hypothetical protein